MALRIGIDYHILAAGGEAVGRGVGRYTQSQLRAVLAAGGDDTYVLLCDHRHDLSLIDPAIRDDERVDVACYRPPRQDPGGLLAQGEHFQDWVDRQGIDVYHATAPLMLDGPDLARFDACPMVATVYDLIPLRFPGHYLVDGDTAERYRRACRLVQQSARVIAISGATRDETAERLGIPLDRIDLAWPVPDPAFRPLTDGQLRKRCLTLEHRLRLPERYVLTVSHLHHTKNLATLLAGYAQLSDNLRTRLPLVVCGNLDAAGAHALMALAEPLGIRDDLLVTGRVSDDELCALYNRATMVVHPSRWEGFGYPVAEAMACGTPVVTTTAASLPEVAGDAAVLVDPEDAAGFADTVLRLANDPDARADLVRLGFQQVKRFDDRQLAGATLGAYARAAAEARPASRSRPRIALWTPLPPLPTGIADYAAELLPALEELCEVEVFVDGAYLPDPPQLEAHTIQHHTAFARRDRRDPFDLILYQVGASPFHGYMAQAITSHPGVVVLHDLVWSNVVYSAPNDAMGFEALLAELHGPAAVEELHSFDHQDNPKLWDFFIKYPMLEPVLRGDLAQIVHVEAAGEELLARYPGTKPWVVHMGVRDPYAAGPDQDLDAAYRRARHELGFPPQRFVAGVFGIVHPLKRYRSCIAALAGAVARGVDALLVIAGPSHDADYIDSLKTQTRRLGVAKRVVFTGALPEKDFRAHMVASDAVVNLRAPVHKHMSAVLMRAIAAGKPILMSDLPDWGYVPDTLCRRIPLDDGEVPALEEGLWTLATDPALRRRMGLAARDFWAREGTPEAMAAGYREVIDRCIQARGPRSTAYRPPAKRATGGRERSREAERMDAKRATGERERSPEAERMNPPAVAGSAP